VTIPLVLRLPQSNLLHRGDNKTAGPLAGDFFPKYARNARSQVLPFR